ncbi:MAG: hypothetical protein RBT51_14850 [Ectothiorhodospiraceae bacterium]|jgi:hypothetical protein|nr:hypothetical protein [Ectothiorhodospiraceae bacterium]
MSKPTAEELKEALEEAGHMREAGQDPHHIAKSLLNLNYRFNHLEKVLQAAERLLHGGMASTDHATLIRAIEEYKRADARSSTGDRNEKPWLS